MPLTNAAPKHLSDLKYPGGLCCFDALGGSRSAIQPAVQLSSRAQHTANGEAIPAMVDTVKQALQTALLIDRIQFHQRFTRPLGETQCHVPTI